MRSREKGCCVVALKAEVHREAWGCLGGDGGRPPGWRLAYRPTAVVEATHASEKRHAESG